MKGIIPPLFFLKKKCFNFFSIIVKVIVLFTAWMIAGFCLFYAIHGVLREREFELYAFIIGIAVIFVYIVIDLIVNSHKRTALKWVSEVFGLRA